MVNGPLEIADKKESRPLERLKGGPGGLNVLDVMA